MEVVLIGFLELCMNEETFQLHWNIASIWTECLWLKHIAELGYGYGLGLGFMSHAEIRSIDLSPSLCNVNMFCIVQCSHRVWNPCQSTYPYPSLAMQLSHYRGTSLTVFNLKFTSHLNVVLLTQINRAYSHRASASVFAVSQANQFCDTLHTRDFSTADTMANVDDLCVNKA